MDKKDHENHEKGCHQKNTKLKLINQNQIYNTLEEKMSDDYDEDDTFSSGNMEEMNYIQINDTFTFDKKILS